jgi:pimeloyl-ACP methyl ester carboxylesterase
VKFSSSRPMHQDCSGHDAPTVVLDAGGGNDWLIWQKVQPELEKTQRVCSYDRAGVGWSELQPGVRDARNISMELHQLLTQAGESKPFVLVAASVAGFYARQYVDRYPSEIDPNEAARSASGPETTRRFRIRRGRVLCGMNEPTQPHLQGGIIRMNAWRQH